MSHTTHTAVKKSRLSLASSFTSSHLGRYDAFLKFVHGNDIIACSLVVVQHLGLDKQVDIPASGLRAEDVELHDVVERASIHSGVAKVRVDQMVCTSISLTGSVRRRDFRMGSNVSAMGCLGSRIVS
jgi:hypothetical protein